MIKAQAAQPVTTQTRKLPTDATAKGKKKSKNALKRRVPRSAAAVLTYPLDKYVDTMTEVRKKISLAEFGIVGGIKTRRAATEAVIFEISGDNNIEKADALAGRIREVTSGQEGVKIDRPLKTAEVRVRGLEWSTTAREVAEAIAEKTRCQRDSIKTGEIRRSPQGLGSLWLKMPLAKAKILCRENHLQVGWFKVTIEMLDVRPLRCHKCFERRHVRSMCPVSADR